MLYVAIWVSIVTIQLFWEVIAEERKRSVKGRFKNIFWIEQLQFESPVQ